MLPCEDCTMGGLKMEPIAWSSDMRKSIALCNDLVPLGSRNVSGHADERKAFTGVEAAFLVRLTCLLHATGAAFLVRLVCLLPAPETRSCLISHTILYHIMSLLHHIVSYSKLCCVMLDLQLTIFGQYFSRYSTRPQARKLLL